MNIFVGISSLFTLGILVAIIVVIVLLVNNKNNFSPQSKNGYRRLTRSQKDRYILGVCGGIAEYFGWETTLVRIVFVLLGAGIAIPYIILAIVVPLGRESL